MQEWLVGEGWYYFESCVVVGAYACCTESWPEWYCEGPLMILFCASDEM